MPTGPTATATPRPENRVRLALTLNGVAYIVRPVPLAELPAGAARVFRLSRTDPRLGRVAYVVAGGRGGPSCTCPHAKYRGSGRGPCKHVAAATACGLI